MYWNKPRFWTYILTNWEHTVLYTGMTNHLPFRLMEHYAGMADSFSSRYKTFYLVWQEETRYVNNAIELEKEIKSWKRDRKMQHIEENNPLWHHLNEDLIGNWPPSEVQLAEMRTYRRHEKARVAKVKGVKGGQ